MISLLVVRVTAEFQFLSVHIRLLVYLGLETVGFI